MQKIYDEWKWCLKNEDEVQKAADANRKSPEIVAESKKIRLAAKKRYADYKERLRAQLHHEYQAKVSHAERGWNSNAGAGRNKKIVI